MPFNESKDEVKVTGLEELAEAMDQLPYRYGRAAARPALNAAGQVFEAALDATVPVDSGELKASIRRKVRVSQNLDDMNVMVGPAYMGGHKETSTDPGVRAKFLEFGTRKMSPTFFMRRAFAASKDAAYNAAVAVLKAVLDGLPK
jgi:HK97 gp10 family phage protein